MLTLTRLFGRSPFAPLLAHMELVSRCVSKIPDLFEALQKEDYEEVNKIALEISKLEHKADLTKNDIRNHLPKTLFLAMDRSRLLEILSIQDSIADVSEDISKMITLKPIKMLPSLKPNFDKYLKKNIEAFEGCHEIVKELHDLVESSFGGIEAEKVRDMVDDISVKEHEADLIQHELLKSLIASENELTYATFFIWQNVFSLIASISNLSEKLANRIRMTLDLK
ncbi:MAG: hypothetical protein K940chlam3_01543 [Chlamydiae bacterium]|nr:hypothetical protein [Chlamydiota bacterium]